MRRRALLVILGLVCALGLALPGCTAREEAPLAESPEATTPAPEPEPESGSESAPAAAEPEAEAPSAYPWLDTELTDAATGRTFTVSEFKGRPVLLHAFAVW